MSYDGDAAEGYEETRAVRARVRRPENGSGTAARLDRLEKALHGQEQALGELAERLSPALMPEPPTPVDGVTVEEPRSELSARLERMCDQAERHRGFIRSLTERIDL